MIRACAAEYGRTDLRIELLGSAERLDPRGELVEVAEQALPVFGQHETVSTPHEQLVTERPAKARQHVAHRRLTQAHALRSLVDAAIA
ncbi:MAG TPA: hypothetical protein VFS52_21205 [Steroidobacteraceae bacterium]|nr:hypothetical protein [Steroidobacteraceae bacterium]